MVIWFLDGLRLVLYTLALAPAFVQFAWYYWVTSHRTVVRYQTDSVRQYLDVYRPSCSSTSSETKDANNTTSSSSGRLPSAMAPLTSPVVFFCCGGAWMIGYKMWGALTARVLTAAGVTVVVPDYRNYPWGTVPQAVDDVETALQWTLDHTTASTTLQKDETVSQNVHSSDAAMDKAETGKTTPVSLHKEEQHVRAAAGAESSAVAPLLSSPVNERNDNKGHVIVVGQSAGGHLIMTLILRKAVEQFKLHQIVTSSADSEEQVNSDRSTFVPTDFSGMITLSAPFHLRAMENVFLKHGLDDHMVDRIFGGQRDDYDPFRILEQEELVPQSILGGERPDAETNPTNCLPVHFQPSPPPLSLAEFLPPMYIYHGSRDQTVPEQGSIDFVDLLQKHGISARYRSYDGWSHTDPILEGPMDADHRFHRDIVDAIVEWTSHDSEDDDNHDYCIAGTTISHRLPEWPSKRA